MTPQHRKLQIAFLMAALLSPINSANAAEPSFASSAKPAGSAPASSPAPSPSIDSSTSAAQQSVSTTGNTAAPTTNLNLNQAAPIPATAAVPAQPLTNQAIKQNTVRSANAAVNGDNSVQSFFQCAPINLTAQEVERRQTTADKNSNKDFSLKKAVYHTLDNIGVPMFTGRMDSQLAPGLTRAYVDPPTPVLGKNKDPHEVEKLFNQEAAIAGGKPSQAPKIPLSELEGTGFDNVPDANPEIHKALPETNAKTN